MSLRSPFRRLKNTFQAAGSHLSPHTSPRWVQSAHLRGHNTLERRPCQGAGGRASTDTEHEAELLLKAPEALDFIRMHLHGSGLPRSLPHNAADRSPSDNRGEAAEKMLHHSRLGVSSRHAMWPADTLPSCWGLGTKAGRQEHGRRTWPKPRAIVTLSGLCLNKASALHESLCYWSHCSMRNEERKRVRKQCKKIKNKKREWMWSGEGVHHWSAMA